MVNRFSLTYHTVLRRPHYFHFTYIPYGLYCYSMQIYETNYNNWSTTSYNQSAVWANNVQYRYIVQVPSLLYCWVTRLGILLFSVNIVVFFLSYDSGTLLANFITNKFIVACPYESLSRSCGLSWTSSLSLFLFTIPVCRH